MDKNTGEQFVAYFLPTEETTAKQARDAENEVNYDADDEYDFKLAREYTWNVKTKETGLFDENYYFIVKDDAIFYNCLETRLVWEVYFERGVYYWSVFENFLGYDWAREDWINLKCLIQSWLFDTETLIIKSWDFR